MKNITITVPEKVAKWARVWAARNNGSVSKLVGELLTERMNEEMSYRASLKRYMAKPATKLRADGKPYPRRDELYD